MLPLLLNRAGLSIPVSTRTDVIDKLKALQCAIQTHFETYFSCAGRARLLVVIDLVSFRHWLMGTFLKCRFPQLAFSL